MHLFNLLPQHRLLVGNLKPQHRLLSTLLRLHAKGLPWLLKHFFSIHCSVFKFKSVTKYFAQGILVTQLIVIYDF